MPDYTRVLKPAGKAVKAVWMVDGMEWLVPLPPAEIVDKADERPARAAAGQPCQLAKMEKDGKPVILKIVNHANRGRWLSIFHGKAQVLELNHFKMEFWDSAVKEMTIMTKKYCSGELDKPACEDRKQNWLKGKCKTPIKRKKVIGEELSGTKERPAKPPAVTLGPKKNPTKKVKTPTKAKAKAKSKASSASSKSNAKAKAKPLPRRKSKADDDEDDEDGEDKFSERKGADAHDDDDDEDGIDKDEDDGDSSTVLEAGDQAEGAAPAPAEDEAPAEDKPRAEDKAPAEQEAPAEDETVPAEDEPAPTAGEAPAGLHPKGKPRAAGKATCKRPAGALKKPASTAAPSTPRAQADDDDDDQPAERNEKGKRLRERRPSSSQSPPSPRFRPVAQHGLFSSFFQ